MHTSHEVNRWNFTRFTLSACHRPFRFLQLNVHFQFIYILQGINRSCFPQWEAVACNAARTADTAGQPHTLTVVQRRQTGPYLPAFASRLGAELEPQPVSFGRRRQHYGAPAR